VYLPQDEKRFTDKVLEVLDQCRHSCATRASYARQHKIWRETGSPDGATAIFNRLDYHILRVAGFLFSPNGLRFAFDYENRYPADVYQQSAAAGLALTKRFTKPRRASDMTPAMAFELGVKESLTYGAAILKTLQEKHGATQRLIMPWQMGVYREDMLGFEAQEAVSETNFVTKYDFWRRVSQKPGGMEIYKRAVANARSRNSEVDGAYAQGITLSGTSPAVLTQAGAPQSGGFMNMAGAPAAMSPEVADDLIELHELWIRNDVTGDWTTVQIAEPDIILTSKLRNENFFVPERHPYTLIQPNQQSGYFWGKTEMQQLFKLQWLLRDRAEDVKKLMGLQFDRLLGFIGQSGMTDTMYDQSRQAGFFSMESGGDIKDLTPQVPENAWQEFDLYFKLFDDLSGFKPIMTGEGDAGVRSGNQAQTLLKTASPQMRDKALLVEFQCAAAAQNLYECMAAKESQVYWVDPDNEESTFLLSQLPPDRTVTVDSHSSSPIYEDEHMQLAAFALKGGVIDGEQFVDMVNGFPQPELTKQKIKQRAEAQQKQIQQLAATDPQAAMKLIQGGKK
jgi:hypothetical protein